MQSSTKKNIFIFAIVMILLLGFVLRIIPYLDGYPYLLTDDSKRDFLEVLHIDSDGSIDFSSAYGAFPVLHLITYFGSKLSGIDYLSVNMFLPQLISVLSLIFFYLFLRRYFSQVTSLIATFITTMFSALIWWSMQPVRETIGIVFFLATIYLFDTLMHKDNKTYLFLTILSSILLVLSHHWSTLIGIIFLFCLIIVKYREEILAWIILAFLTVMAIFWWLVSLPLVFSLISKFFTIITEKSFLIFVGLIFLIGIFILIKYLLDKGYTIQLSHLKSKNFQILLNIFLILTFILVQVLLNTLLVMVYPIQTFLSIFLLGLLTLNGFFIIQNWNKIHYFSLLTFALLASLIVLGIFIGGNNVAFDPVRVIEYFPFALSIFAASFIVYLWEKTKENIALISTIFVLIILGGLFIYPTAFLTNEQIDSDSIFFDIRSLVRYFPEEVDYMYDWLIDNNISITSSNPEYLDQSRIFFYDEDSTEAVLVTEYDLLVLELSDKINVYDLVIHEIEESTEDKNLIYDNGWAEIFL